MEELEFTLFKDFLMEGIDFISEGNYDFPTVKIASDSCMNWGGERLGPTIFRRDLNIIEVDVPNLKSAADYRKPTLMRNMAYGVAWIWYKQLPINRLSIVVSRIFALSVTLLKGVDIDEMLTDNDKALILDFLKKEFKLDCVFKKVGVGTVGTNEYLLRERLTFTTSQNRKYFDEWESVANASINLATPTVKAGDKGTKEKPFENVDEAASFILQLEKEYLAGDPYRCYIDNAKYEYQGIFRIPWAAPTVSFMRGPNVINDGFVVNQLRSQRFSIKPCLVGRKFLFRGQTEMYDPCKPTLYRSVKEKPKELDFIEDLIDLCELQTLIDSHPLAKMLGERHEIFNDYFRFEVNYDGLSQHYDNRTQYLDLTCSMEVAKFFATIKVVNNEEFSIYPGNELGVLYYYDLKPDAFTHELLPRLTTIGKQAFMRSGAQHGFILKMDWDQNFNTFEEVGCVYFKHDKEIAQRILEESNFGKKYIPREGIIQSWKSIKDHKNKNRVVSRECLCNLYERLGHKVSKSKILKRLKELNYRVDPKYTPQLSEAEREEVYNEFEKIWKEFCNDIYFFSPEGRVLKAEMQKLRI